MGAAVASAAAKPKEIPRKDKLKQELERVQRGLYDVYKDLCMAGDDPYRMGAAFVEVGGGESDDEYPEFYERSPIRTEEGHLLPRSAQRLMDLFRKYDADGDGELCYGEFRRFLSDGDVLEELDAVCNTEEEWKLSIAGVFDVSPTTGNLRFPGFLDLLERAWDDRQIINVAARCGVEIRYHCITEKFRILRIFKQCGVNVDGRLPVSQLQLMAFECGVTLSDSQTRELQLKMLSETKKLDRMQLANADAEGVGTGVIEELSDEDAPTRATTAHSFRKRAISGFMSFGAWLDWWYSIGYAKSQMQKAALSVFNAPIPVTFLRLGLQVESLLKRHLAVTHVLLEEHVRQALAAGVFDTTRPRTANASRARFVASAYCGRPKSAASLAQTMFLEMKSRIVEPSDALAAAHAPPGAWGFIHIGLAPEEYIGEEEVDGMVAAIRSAVAMDFAPYLFEIPGLTRDGVRVYKDYEGEVLLLHIVIFLDKDPIGFTQPLKDYLEARTPPAVRAAQTQAETSKARVRGAVEAAVGSDFVRPTTPGSRSSSRPGSRPGTSVSQRAARRATKRLAVDKAKDRQSDSKSGDGGIRSKPKSNLVRRVIHDLTARMTSTFSFKDWFSGGLSLKRAVEFKVDLAAEVDPTLLAALGDSIDRALDYLVYQLDLQTPGDPVDEPQTGGFSRTAREKTEDVTVVEPRKRLWVHAVRGLCRWLRRIRHTTDVQLKWQAADIAEVIEGSGFLASALGRERYRKLVKLVTTKGSMAMWRMQLHADLKEFLGRLKKSAMMSDEDLGIGDSESSTSEDEAPVAAEQPAGSPKAEGGTAAPVGSPKAAASPKAADDGMASPVHAPAEAADAAGGAGGPAPPTSPKRQKRAQPKFGGGGGKARTVRMFRLGTRLAAGLNSIQKITLQLGDLRLEANMEGFDAFSVLHPDKDLKKKRRKAR